ncbi:hypothetical protein HYT05_02420 [Candidatus Kaiserbacteria bacterium]|nr:hypothetical protein [Candidatus Kaiserbacteria bacterium]
MGIENPFGKKRKIADSKIAKALALGIAATPMAGAAEAGQADHPPTTSQHFEMTVPTTPEGMKKLSEGLKKSNEDFKERQARDFLKWLGKDYDTEVKENNKRMEELRQERDRLQKEGF